MLCLSTINTQAELFTLFCSALTLDQHLDRQIKALLDCGVAERDIVTDKISGIRLEREGYMALRNTMLRDGDTLIIKSLDRLSRNKQHILKELRHYKEHHIQVKVIDLPTTMIQHRKDRNGYLK